MKYSGSCHCKKIRYEVEMKIENVLSCNCSICSKKGHLLAFAPEASFKLLSGEDNLADYQFRKKIIHHHFCKTCGVSSFGKGKDPKGNTVCAINVRCLDDVDVTQFPVIHFDGKGL